LYASESGGNGSKSVCIATFKRRTVAQERHNNNWIRNLQSIDCTSQLEEFTLLFMALANIQLTDQKDDIKWNWTIDRKFSVSSAY
jgi:hypothetical protein